MKICENLKQRLYAKIHKAREVGDLVSSLYLTPLNHYLVLLPKKTHQHGTRASQKEIYKFQIEETEYEGIKTYFLTPCTMWSSTIPSFQQ